MIGFRHGAVDVVAGYTRFRLRGIIQVVLEVAVANEEESEARTLLNQVRRDAEQVIMSLELEETGDLPHDNVLGPQAGFESHLTTSSRVMSLTKTSSRPRMKLPIPLSYQSKDFGASSCALFSATKRL